MGGFSFKQIRRFAYLLVLVVFALFELSRSKLVRRTFQFYSFDRGRPVVEDRMLPRSASREEEISRYVEEILLGPVSVNSAPVLTKGTQLRSFLYRDGTVYADFGQIAALPVAGAKNDVFEGMAALNRGVRRNFPYVTGVKLFIEGNEVFVKEFKDIFEK
jgi:hypothetical protein